MPQPVVNVFNHHHGGVHHQANGNGQTAQRHEVGRDAIAVHQNEGGQWRDDERGHHNQTRAHIAQKDKQHHNDQKDAFNQHLGHGPQRRVDQLSAIVVRHNFQAIGQHVFVVDLIDPLLHTRDNFFGIAAAHHEHDARNTFGVAALDDGALAHFAANLNLRYISHKHRHTGLFFDHDVANVFQ